MPTTPWWASGLAQPMPLPQAQPATFGDWFPLRLPDGRVLQSWQAFCGDKVSPEDAGIYIDNRLFTSNQFRSDFWMGCIFILVAVVMPDGPSLTCITYSRMVIMMISVVVGGVFLCVLGVVVIHRPYTLVKGPTALQWELLMVNKTVKPIIILHKVWKPLPHYRTIIKVWEQCVSFSIRQVVVHILARLCLDT